MLSETVLLAMRMAENYSAAELVNDGVHQFVDDGENARRGLESALELHEVGHFLVERDTADGVALGAHEFLDAGLRIDGGVGVRQRVPELADALGKETAERAGDRIAA